MTATFIDADATSEFPLYNTQPVTVAWPTPPTDGDLLLVAASWDGGFDGVNPSIEGYQRLASIDGLQDAAAIGARGRAWARISDGTETDVTASITAEAVITTAPVLLAVLQFQGARLTVGWSHVSSASSGSFGGTPPASTAFFDLDDDGVAVAFLFAAYLVGSIPNDTPAGWTEAVDVNDGIHKRLQVLYRAVSEGPVPTATWTDDADAWAVDVLTLPQIGKLVGSPIIHVTGTPIRVPHGAGLEIRTPPEERRALAKRPPDPTPAATIPGPPWIPGPGPYRPAATDE